MWVNQVTWCVPQHDALLSVSYTTDQWLLLPLITKFWFLSTDKSVLLVWLGWSFYRLFYDTKLHGGLDLFL